MRSKKLALFCAGVLVIQLTAGCAFFSTAEKGPEAAPAVDRAENVLFSDRAMLDEVYCLSAPDYRVYTSELLDLYLISCALYFDFKSQELLPDAEKDGLYKQAMDYFTPYRDHPFIKGLEPFVDVENRAQRHGVVFPLLMYVFSMTDYGMDVNMVQTDAFQNGEEFQSFLTSLHDFYEDTKARDFFQSVQPQRDMAAYLKEGLESWNMDALLSGMESYVGNQDALYPGQTVKYRSVMTLYRPLNASFYTFNFGDSVYLIGQQSPIGVNKKSDQLDMGQTVNTTIHEFLHSYINQPVAEQEEQIALLSQGKKKTDYAGDLYVNMEWPRIVDESVVRVVETAIFRDVMGDGKAAYDLILKKEVQYSGMPRLQEMYDALSAYEDGRDSYQTIESYLPKLIEVMFG